MISTKEARKKHNENSHKGKARQEKETKEYWIHSSGKSSVRMKMCWWETFCAWKKIQNCANIFFSHLNVYLTPHLVSPLMIQLVFHQNFTLHGKNCSSELKNDMRHASHRWNGCDVTYFCITILEFFSNLTIGKKWNEGNDAIFF